MHIGLLFAFLSTFAAKFELSTSQLYCCGYCRATTYFRCDENITNSVANSTRCLAVNELWKSVNIWQSYSGQHAGLLLSPAWFWTITSRVSPLLNTHYCQYFWLMIATPSDFNFWAVYKCKYIGHFLTPRTWNFYSLYHYRYAIMAPPVLAFIRCGPRQINFVSCFSCYASAGVKAGKSPLPGGR